MGCRRMSHRMAYTKLIHIGKICCIFGRFCYTMNRSKCLPFVMRRGKKHNV